MDTTEHIREFWDADAATYDASEGHHPTDPLVRAAWSGALADLLPAAPARVLDVGAGTGFLSLLAAELGHEVTAVDVSGGMLERLRAKAAAAGLEVATVQASAEAVQPGDWAAVMSRHLLWTLPDPAAALRAWRAAAPGGRLVLLESTWGAAADPVERARAAGREWLRRARRTPHDHHGSYDAAVRAALPLAGGAAPERIVELAAAAGWRAPQLRRLTAIEWASTRHLPWPERLLGVAPRFAVTAR